MKIEITPEHIKFDYSFDEKEGDLLDYWFELLHYNCHKVQKIVYHGTNQKELYIKRGKSQKYLEWKKNRPKIL